MGRFAFRNDLPKSEIGRSWDRDTVASALRTSRKVGKMVRDTGADSEHYFSEEPKHKGGIRGGKNWGDIDRAAHALIEQGQRPAKKFSKEWSDNQDRETLGFNLIRKLTSE